MFTVSKFLDTVIMTDIARVHIHINYIFVQQYCARFFAEITLEMERSSRILHNICSFNYKIQSGMIMVGNNLLMINTQEKNSLR